MASAGDGYFQVHLEGVGPGALYKFDVGGRELPDPYARYLPGGVHGAAQVVTNEFKWQHGEGIARPLRQQSIYELHVGTFSEAGTYDGVRARLPQLRALGITTIELMPLAAFPGQRGWGYDGVALFAPFAPYGTPDDLRRLVDEAHGLGLGVLLDVVYNHFGPAGNYLPSYSARYFTSQFHNAWGDAVNYADPIVRRLVIENALYWLTEFRFDGLRLDATHAIIDPSKPHILGELTEAVARLQPSKVLIAEDSRNQSTLVTECGLHAVWADDFHHQLRVTFTRESDGYYAAHRPGVADLARVIERGWLYEGQVDPVRGQPRGTPAETLEAEAFVYCIQNHDQVGNRATGDRLSDAISLEQYRAASTLLLFLPMTPLLFMGQEWAASTPFLFFTDHDEELGRLIVEGRRSEFAGFQAFASLELRERIPNPQAAATFEASRLQWKEREREPHAGILALYEALLALRASDPVLRASSRRELTAQAKGDVLLVRRRAGQDVRQLVMNFGERPVPLDEVVGRAGARILVRSDGLAGEAREVPRHTAVITT
jgi:maltooligosyltrehalose trehalohydrolase